MTHSGEKPNKCNQCDYASYRAGDLRTHLKTHSGEKSNKCSQCDFICFLKELGSEQAQTSVKRRTITICHCE